MATRTEKEVLTDITTVKTKLESLEKIDDDTLVDIDVTDHDIGADITTVVAMPWSKAHDHVVGCLWFQLQELEHELGHIRKDAS